MIADGNKEMYEIALLINNKIKSNALKKKVMIKFFLNLLKNYPIIKLEIY
ncbi:MAG: hypothetical protein ACFYI8_00400 [Candidatus Karelsulcia muelleri]